MRDVPSLQDLNNFSSFHDKSVSKENKVENYHALNYFIYYSLGGHGIKV